MAVITVDTTEQLQAVLVALSKEGCEHAALLLEEGNNDSEVLFVANPFGQYTPEAWSVLDRLVDGVRYSTQFNKIEDFSFEGTVDITYPGRLSNVVYEALGIAMYPTEITIFCDRCGAEHSGDYLVSELDDRYTRQSYARNHLAKKGWVWQNDMDFCAACAQKISR